MKSWRLICHRPWKIREAAGVAVKFHDRHPPLNRLGQQRIGEMRGPVDPDRRADALVMRNQRHSVGSEHVAVKSDVPATQNQRGGFHAVPRKKMGPQHRVLIARHTKYIFHDTLS